MCAARTRCARRRAKCAPGSNALGPRWDVNTQRQEPPPAALAMNDIGEVRIALAQPIVADRYADNHATGSFILIDEATNATVAAGLIR